MVFEYYFNRKILFLWKNCAIKVHSVVFLNINKYRPINNEMQIVKKYIYKNVMKIPYGIDIGTIKKNENKKIAFICIWQPTTTIPMWFKVTKCRLNILASLEKFNSEVPKNKHSLS